MRWTPRRLPAPPRPARTGRGDRPFARPVDRLAARLRVVLMLFAALTIVVSAGVTVAAFSAAQTRAADQHARTQPVAANIAPDSDGAAVPQTTTLAVGSEPATASVSWRWAGQTRTDIIELPAGTHPGDRTSILVDASGAWAGPEITPARVVGSAISALIASLIGATALTGALYAWGKRHLERHRQRYWDQCLHRFFATYR
ncbi:hypothetical protein ACFTWF_22380 [Rhodococcus sp. NPDC056960]|uniref:Rv1733c family protein n=1 Tax=Rhodococcus sp. NPDC056960 TaxID=3345982 RepID=UPI00363B3C36